MKIKVKPFLSPLLPTDLDPLKQDRPRRAIYGLLASMLMLPGAIPPAHGREAADQSPEKTTLEMSRNLRPISDEDWDKISGMNSDQKYQIERGDTLYDISKKLFGDPRYWPKIWALNNDTIMNPHVILPGRQITFISGTGVSLPHVAIEVHPAGLDPTEIADERGMGRGHPPSSQGRSSEWKEYPEQPWEYASRNKKIAPSDSIISHQSLNVNYAANILTDRIYEIFSEAQKPIGMVAQSPKSDEYIGPGDRIIIHVPGGIEPGTYLTVTGEGLALKEDNDAQDEKIQLENTRRAWVYERRGEVQILSQANEDYWLAQVISSRAVILRGNLVLPQFPKFKLIDPPLPGPSPLQGKFLTDPETDAPIMISVGQIGFVNLGSRDGVTEGMLFQSFQSLDPNTGQKMIKDDLFPRVTMEVIQTTDTFSVVDIISGRTIAGQNDLVELMTDTSAFGGSAAPSPQPAPAASPTGIRAESPEPLPEPSVEPQPSPSAEEALPEPSPTPQPEPSLQALPSPEPSPSATSMPEENLPPIPEKDAPNDEDETLGKDEERELKQLENHKPDASLLAPTNPNPATDSSQPATTPSIPETAPNLTPVPIPMETPPESGTPNKPADLGTLPAPP